MAAACLGWISKCPGQVPGSLRRITSSSEGDRNSRAALSKVEFVNKIDLSAVEKLPCLEHPAVNRMININRKKGCRCLYIKNF
jgi:hypothetical protein